MIVRKTVNEKNDDAQSWLISYADIMTILLTFFVILTAISQVDYSRYDLFRESFAKEMNKNADNPVSKQILDRKKVKENIATLIKKQDLKGKIALDENPLGLKLTFPSHVFFASGKADLTNEFEDILKGFITVLGRIEYNDYYIAVLGHTDDVPIHTTQYPSNWELASARSARVTNFLIEQGLERSRIKISGFADTRPLEPILEGDMPEIVESKRAKNRRIEIQINYYKNKF
ncbi:MAG: flagellar motor protein MotB [bacterium]